MRAVSLCVIVILSSGVFGAAQAQETAPPPALKGLYAGEVQLIERMVGAHLPVTDDRYAPDNVEIARRLAAGLSTLPTSLARADYLKAQVEAVKEQRNDLRALENSSVANKQAIELRIRDTDIALQHLTSLEDYHRGNHTIQAVPGDYQPNEDSEVDAADLDDFSTAQDDLEGVFAWADDEKLKRDAPEKWREKQARELGISDEPAPETPQPSTPDKAQEDEWTVDVDPAWSADDAAAKAQSALEKDAAVDAAAANRMEQATAKLRDSMAASGNSSPANDADKAADNALDQSPPVGPEDLDQTPPPNSEIGESAGQTNAAEDFAAIMQSLNAALDDVYERYGYQNSGMQNTLDQHLEQAGIGWARGNYLSTWSEWLTYDFEGGSRTPWKYLLRRQQDFKDVADLEATSELVEAARDGLGEVQGVIQQLDLIYNTCVFPGLVETGTRWDEYHALNQEYHAALGAQTPMEEASPIWEAGEAERLAGEETLNKALDCLDPMAAVFEDPSAIPASSEGPVTENTSHMDAPGTPDAEPTNGTTGAAPERTTGPSASATDPETGITTISVANGDGTRTVTRVDADGTVLSSEIVGTEPTSASATDPKTGVTTTATQGPDGTRKIDQTAEPTGAPPGN